MKCCRLLAVLGMVSLVGILTAVVWPRPSRERLPPDPNEVHILSAAEKDIVPPLLNHLWPEFDPNHGKILALHGATEQQVVTQLGEPNQTREFPVVDVPGEFGIELWNTYPPNDPRSQDVRIREWQWKYHEFSFAVWFHKVDGQWVVLDTCRWKKGVVF